MISGTSVVTERSPYYVGTSFTLGQHNEYLSVVVQQRLDETANPAPKAASISELVPAEGDKPKIAAKRLPAQLGLDKRQAGVVGQEVFESIYNPGKLLLLVTWRDAETAKGWTPVAAVDLGKVRHRRVRVIRDYGMIDHHEAPQFYSEIKRAQGVAAE